MGISGFLIVFSPFLVFLPQIAAIYQLIKNRKLNAGTPWTGGVLLLFFWSLIVGVVNQQWLSFGAGFVFLGFYGICLYLDQKMHTVELVERLLRYIFFLTLASALIGLLENFNFITREAAWWKICFGLTTVVSNDDTLFRITGTFGNPNLAASWYAVMILVGYYFYEKTPKNEHRIFFYGILLLITALVLTGSRGAMIGLMIGFVVYDLAAGKMFHVTIRMLSFLIGMGAFIGSSDWFPRGDLLSSTIDLRWAIWENCFNMFLKKPVTGWGIMGIYFADDNVYQYLRVLHAHNMLLSWVVMLGLVGLFLLLWMEWHLWGSLWQLFKEKCPLMPLLVAVQAFFWGHGVFDFSIMSPQIGLLCMVFSSLICTLAGSENSKPYFSAPKRFFCRLQGIRSLRKTNKNQ